MNPNEEKDITKLEDNIIDIPVPNTIPEMEINQPNQQVTPLPEVHVEEHETEEKNDNPMVEKQHIDEKVTGKSLAPLIIIFTIFIISIIGLPYIDDLIALINPKQVEEESIPVPNPTPTSSPIITPTPTPSASPNTVPSEIIDNLTQ